MDLKGFEAINGALQANNLEAIVTPEPAEGEHVQFVTIETDPNVAPAEVLNALGKVGLVAETAAQQMAGQYADAVFVHGPKLEPLFGQPGSVTFVDTNNRR